MPAPDPRIKSGDGHDKLGEVEPPPGSRVFRANGRFRDGPPIRARVPPA
jgi:hypothetical protein